MREKDGIRDPLRSAECCDMSPSKKTHRSHKDPTADAAIGYVMTEEQRKHRKKLQTRQQKVRVWRALEGGESHARK